MLTQAEQAGYDWPYSTRCGACPTAAAYLVSGQVDQSDQTFFTDEQMQAGIICTDVAYPESNCTIVISVEDETDTIESGQFDPYYEKK